MIKGIAFEIIGTLLAAAIQGVMLSIVGSSSGCHNATLGALIPTPSNIYSNESSYMPMLRQAPNNSSGKSTIVCVLFFRVNLI